MIIPLRHERMSTRRLPIVTFAIIALNIIAFLATNGSIQSQRQALGTAKAHLLMLAAMHPELHVPPENAKFVSTFQKSNPEIWEQLKRPDRGMEDAWDTRMRMTEDGGDLQGEMNTLSLEYTRLKSQSITEQYAFIPASHSAISYLTANFLHGGWLHLIGNMWFLWLAGFVLEDAWGRGIYSAVYLVSGIVALQFHAWMYPNSLVPTLGASGAVAALMGAFLICFPTLKIEMAWLFLFGLRFRFHRFKMAAFWLLPLWLLMEVCSGFILGESSGVAHWAHVGGFVFGAVAALGIRYSGLEKKMNDAIEDKISITSAPEIAEATELMHSFKTDEALAILQPYFEQNPTSIDACLLLQQAYIRKGDLESHRTALAKLCDLHLSAREYEAAWKDYEEFLEADGGGLPPGTWFELCRAAEQIGKPDRAYSEFQSFAATYPNEKQSLQAQLSAARIALKKLNRPEEALMHFEQAQKSPIPHLDLESAIAAGIRDAKAAVAAPVGASPASA